MEWPNPRSVTEVRSFLGLAGYYRKFVENLSKKIARSLFKIRKKGVRFQWGEKHSKSLEELNRRLTTTPVLTMPNYGKHLRYIKELNMRQRRWLEIIKDFEVDINYHPRKAKKVADALSRRPRISVNVIMTIPWELYLEIQKLDLEIFNHYPVVSYQTNIKMAPDEALYGRKCRVSLCWDQMDLNVPEEPDLIQDSIDSLGWCKRT
ncbi:uncharacterized protein LOC130813411 [Amaranthus tricolor]|uniref:uncharacterized protein LOC130813411 n=1 Tax=Amaranthus tricolor TaxID=29722 RepID=UPI00258504CA|nr:uncharacterized protein LOC130813411 [Amaranthus tricolor]